MKIAITCDHTGFNAMTEIKIFIESLGHGCINLGPKSLSTSDDYPDFVVPAAKAIATGQYDRAIVVGGSGQGEAMSANRINGVRCAVFYGTAVPKRSVDVNGSISHDPYEILKLTRMHNDSNMLSLAARFLSPADINRAIKIWLDTEFLGEPRHARRIAKLDKEV